MTSKVSKNTAGIAVYPSIRFPSVSTQDDSTQSFLLFLFRTLFGFVELFH